MYLKFEVPICVQLNPVILSSAVYYRHYLTVAIVVLATMATARINNCGCSMEVIIMSVPIIIVVTTYC